MSSRSSEITRTSRILIAITLCGALLAAALVVSSNNEAKADSATRAKKTKVLGAIGKLPEPLCPRACLGMAIVSGFQAEIDGVGTPYRVPYNGYITKWKLSLGSVTRAQRKFFANRFGRKPKAGLSILKPVRVKGKRRYKLMKRSHVEGLNRDLGSVVSYRVRKPIRVKKGWYVALTVPTWAPALATVTRRGKPDPGFSWRASRNRRKCMKAPNERTSSPQKKLGSKVQYGCRFDGQLLYRVKVTNRVK